MITEDYVDFSTAKLLKEKGFDEPCYMAYVPTHKEYMMRNDAGHSNSMHPADYYAAPTLQMAMKWLREVYKIFICPLFVDDSNCYGYTIESLATIKFLATSGSTPYESYEVACEAAIKYCLENLI